jgi:uncharacterized protein
MAAIELLIAASAAIGAGLVNALAGGGTLVSFPVLLALGVPPIAANVTNAVALCPGYFGATLAQNRNLEGQRARLWVLMPVGIVGGLTGALILLRTGERTFEALVPWMILIASLLLALQERVRAFVTRRLNRAAEARHSLPATAALVGAAAIYGGFFSAGMSVLLLAVLGLGLDDTLTRLNALKQGLAFAVNVAAVVLFLGSGTVIWSLAAVMAVGALIGGSLGGRLANRLPPGALRWTIVIVGIAIAVSIWVRS